MTCEGLRDPAFPPPPNDFPDLIASHSPSESTGIFLKPSLVSPRTSAHLFLPPLRNALAPNLGPANSFSFRSQVTVHLPSKTSPLTLAETLAASLNLWHFVIKFVSAFLVCLVF